MKLHLIRHGETVTSGRTYAGRSDVALSARGRAQARQIARDLSRRPIVRIVTSPLSRAAETARPLAVALNLAPVEDPDLVEIDFGIHEGRPKRDLGLKLRAAHAVVPIDGGESLWQVWVRAGAVLNRLRGSDLPEDAEIALVGHFWINRLIRGRATGLDFDAACRARDYRPATGSVFPLDVGQCQSSNGSSPIRRSIGA